MKINLLDDEKGLLIVPETDFEETFIRSMHLDSLKAFVKTGLTPKDIIGLKIVPIKEGD